MAVKVDLRALGPDDKDRLLVWRNSPDVAAYMYTDHPIAAAEHERWFAAIAGDERRAYWVIEVDGIPVGLANLYDIDQRNSRCAWAYYLADPSVRGKGVGGYVEFRTIDHVFGELRLGKLWCEVLASNEAVWRLHQKFGFQQEARLRRHIVKNGAPEDVIGLGLLAEEWTIARPVMAQRMARLGFAV